MKYWLAYLLSLFVLTGARGQIFQARLDTPQIKIGEQCQLLLRYDGRAGDTVALPDLKDTINTHIEILHASKADTLYDSLDITRRSIAKSYTITSFDSGYWPIPPITLIASGDTLQSDPLLLSVATVPVDTTKAIFDIKAPLGVKYSWKDWLADHWQWFAWGLALTGALLALFLAWRHFRNRPVAEPVKPKPKVPPHIIALKQLDELEQKKLWQQGQYKKYHSILSAIIRTFIEQQLGIPALEQISDEIIDALKYTDTETSEIDKLAVILRLADMVKFAKERPVATENKTALETARSFVKSISEKMGAQAQESAHTEGNANAES